MNVASVTRPRDLRLLGTGGNGLVGQLSAQVEHKGLPKWLAGVECLHRADIHPVSMLFDASVIAAGFLATGSPLKVAAVFFVAFLLLSPLFGVACRRTTIESQGVLWYARPLVCLCAVLLVPTYLHPFGLKPHDAGASLALGAGILLLVRSLLWLVISAARRRRIGLRPALVIGNQARIDQLTHRLETYPEVGLRFAAGYTPDLADIDAVEDGHAQAFSLLERDEVDHVLFVSDGIYEPVFQEFVLRASGRKGYTLVQPLPHLSGRRTPHHLADLGVIPLPIGNRGNGMVAKRAFDLVAASVLVVLFAPIMAVAGLAIWLQDRGPVIFRQKRLGVNGKPFTMYKLRSMVVGAEKQRDEYLEHNVNSGLLFKLHNDPRVTPLGWLLRRFGIDELPQLFNVLKGDMSLVGPRPLPVALEEVEGPALRRHAVPPGITGLWQVEGGNALTYQDMVDLDLTYIATRTLAYDVRLLLRTVPALAFRRSAY